MLCPVIASSVDLLDPQHLVLGGELFLEANLFYDAVAEHIHRHSYKALSDPHFTIRRSTILRTDIERYLVRNLWNHVRAQATN